MKQQRSKTKKSKKAKHPAQWVFIRGLAREQGHWGNFRKLAFERFGSENVHFLDLPGTGTERSRQSPSKIPAITDDLRSRLQWRFSERQLSVEVKIHLVAISLGGMVAIDWIKRFPDDFSNAYLINSSLRGLSPITARLRLRNWPAVLRSIFESDAAQRENRVFSMVCNREQNRKQTVALWTEIAKDRPLLKKTFFKQLLAASKFKAPNYITSNTNVRVLVSASDRLVDCRCSFRIAERYDWPVSLHLSGGHDLTTDDPEWVLDQLTDFA